MSQCSIRNKNTGEPKLFYTSNKGELFTSLYEVLNNTDTSYNIGFLKEDNSFIGKIEVPIFDENIGKAFNEYSYREVKLRISFEHKETMLNSNRMKMMLPVMAKTSIL